MTKLAEIYFKNIAKSELNHKKGIEYRVKAGEFYNEGYFKKAMEYIKYAQENGVVVHPEFIENTQRAINKGGLFEGRKNVRPAR